MDSERENDNVSKLKVKRAFDQARSKSRLRSIQISRVVSGEHGESISLSTDYAFDDAGDYSLTEYQQTVAILGLQSEIMVLDQALASGLLSKEDYDLRMRNAKIKYSLLIQNILSGVKR